MAETVMDDDAVWADAGTPEAVFPIDSATLADLSEATGADLATALDGGSVPAGGLADPTVYPSARSSSTVSATSKRVCSSSMAPMNWRPIGSPPSSVVEHGTLIDGCPVRLVG